jgi:hypothetical protein
MRNLLELDERKRNRLMLAFKEYKGEYDPVAFNDVVPRPVWSNKATKNQRRFKLPRNKVRR